MGARGPAATRRRRARPPPRRRSRHLLLVIRQPTPRDLPSVPSSRRWSRTANLRIRRRVALPLRQLPRDVLRREVVLGCGYEASCAATATMAWPRAGASRLRGVHPRRGVAAFHVDVHRHPVRGDPSVSSVSRASSAGPDLALYLSTRSSRGRTRARWRCARSRAETRAIAGTGRAAMFASTTRRRRRPWRRLQPRSRRSFAQNASSSPRFVSSVRGSRSSKVWRLGSVGARLVHFLEAFLLNGLTVSLEPTSTCILIS